MCGSRECSILHITEAVWAKCSVLGAVFFSCDVVIGSTLRLMKVKNKTASEKSICRTRESKHLWWISEICSASKTGSGSLYQIRTHTGQYLHYSLYLFYILLYSEHVYCPHVQNRTVKWVEFSFMASFVKGGLTTFRLFEKAESATKWQFVVYTLMVKLDYQNVVVVVKPV